MDDRLRQDLRRVCRGDLRFDEPMARHTSFGIGGPADAFVLPGDLDEVRTICQFLTGRDIPILPLGDGTNMLVSDAGWRGVSQAHLALFESLLRQAEAFSLEYGPGDLDRVPGLLGRLLHE